MLANYQYFPHNNLSEILLSFDIFLNKNKYNLKHSSKFQANNISFEPSKKIFT